MADSPIVTVFMALPTARTLLPFAMAPPPPTPEWDASCNWVAGAGVLVLRLSIFSDRGVGQVSGSPVAEGAQFRRLIDGLFGQRR